MALRALETKKGGLSSRSIRHGAILPSRLSRLISEGKYALETFSYVPRASLADGYSAPTGATGDTNQLSLRGLHAAYFILGAGQTLLAPTWDATNGGLLAGLDAAAAEGVEYAWGGISARNPFAVVVGTSPNAFIRATVRAATVANVAELAVGWRKAEAFQALLDGYDEMAVLNMQAGDIKRETILNNAATVTVDTLLNATDATDFTLEVRLVGRRALMFVNGDEAPIGAAFSFDVGETVVPFAHFLQGAGASTLHLVDLEIGPLYAIDLDPARR